MARSQTSGVFGLGEQPSPDIVGRPRAKVRINDYSYDPGRTSKIVPPSQVINENRSIDVNADVKTPTDPVAAELRAQSEAASKEKIALAGAQFGLDILNASTQYKNIEGTTRFNILQSKNQAADAIYRGRQAGLAAQSEGRGQGEDALLALVAQGQSADSAGVQRVVRSYEAIGEQNAALAETNAMREALGFELEQVGAQFQLENARINRDMQYITSFLKFGAQSAGAMY